MPVRMSSLLLLQCAATCPNVVSAQSAPTVCSPRSGNERAFVCFRAQVPKDAIDPGFALYYRHSTGQIATVPFTLDNKAGLLVAEVPAGFIGPSWVVDHRVAWYHEVNHHLEGKWVWLEANQQLMAGEVSSIEVECLRYKLDDEGGLRLLVPEPHTRRPAHLTLRFVQETPPHVTEGLTLSLGNAAHRVRKEELDRLIIGFARLRAMQSIRINPDSQGQLSPLPGETLQIITPFGTNTKRYCYTYRLTLRMVIRESESPIYCGQTEPFDLTIECERNLVEEARRMLKEAAGATGSIAP